MSWNDELGSWRALLTRCRRSCIGNFPPWRPLRKSNRLLLGNPELKSILSTLLPRAVALLGCDAIAIVLFDADPAGDTQAFAYEQYAGLPAQRDPRIIVSGIAGLKTACNYPAVQVVRNRQQPYFSSSAHPIATLRTFPLKRG